MRHDRGEQALLRHRRRVGVALVAAALTVALSWWGVGVSLAADTTTPVTTPPTVPADTTPADTLTVTTTVPEPPSTETVTRPAPPPRTVTLTVAPPSTTAASTQSDQADSSVDWGWVAFGVLAFGLLVGGIVWWWRGRHDPQAPTPSP